jgi:predicted amidohydrolase YtcJ
LLRAIELATENCWAHGITSFQDAGSSFGDVALFRELAEEGQLGVRLWVMLDDPNDELQRFAAEYRTIGFADNYLTVRAIKRMVDGALGTHGAWLLAPYDDLPGSTGHNTTSLALLKQTAELARQLDMQLCVHAIGDRANHEVLDLFETELGSTARGKRWRIEHAQHIAPEDIPRFGQLGVIASMQAVHCTSDAPFVVQRLGERRARTGAYVWRSLLDGGAMVINGTDVPVENIDPIACFYSSVTRRLANGVEFFPEQCMTRLEALRSYTRDAAFAAFEEDLKGVLAQGFLADLVVLDRDLLAVPDDQIPATRVHYTVVGGKIRYMASN